MHNRSIRVSAYSSSLLMGMPYKTLIASVLHEHVAGRLTEPQGVEEPRVPGAKRRSS